MGRGDLIGRERVTLRGQTYKVPAVGVWCLSSGLSFLVGLSIQDEAVDVARSAPQGAHYHADVIYLLP